MIIQTLAIQKLKIVINNFNLKINSCFPNIIRNQFIRNLSKFTIFRNQGILGVDKNSLKTKVNHTLKKNKFKRINYLDAKY